MFDQQQHKTMLVRILKEIYSDPSLRTMLGFKGGTAAYLFYDLPQLSVDLDFDLLDKSNKTEIFNTVKQILSQYGSLSDAIEKRDTFFFLMRYQKDGRNIKVEISKRPTTSAYEVRSYLGIPVLIMKKEDMAAHKLAALLTRDKFASRDVFDLWYFLKNDWKINELAVKERTDLTLPNAIKKAVEKVESIKPNVLLHGLGDILDEKQKSWVREKLKDELIFNLKLRL